MSPLFASYCVFMWQMCMPTCIFQLNEDERKVLLVVATAAKASESTPAPRLPAEKRKHSTAFVCSWFTEPRCIGSLPANCHFVTHACVCVWVGILLHLHLATFQHFRTFSIYVKLHNFHTRKRKCEKRTGFQIGSETKKTRQSKVAAVQQ